MKKHPLRYGTTAMLFSFLFFLLAVFGFYHMIFFKLPAHPSLPASIKYDAVSYKIGQFIGLYVPPFVIAIGGWLLLKFGIEKVNESAEVPNT